jgi:surface antigen
VRETLLALVVAAGLVAPAGAQINPFGPYSADNLNAEDRRLAEDAARKIYKTNAPIGAEQSWSNSDTGNSGTITLIRVHEYQGMPCRTLEQRVEMKGRNEPIVFHTDRCMTPAGEWKLL